MAGWNCKHHGPCALNELSQNSLWQKLALASREIARDPKQSTAIGLGKRRECGHRETSAVQWLSFSIDSEQLAWVGFDLARVVNYVIQIPVVAGLSRLIAPDLDVADRTRSSRAGNAGSTCR